MFSPSIVLALLGVAAASEYFSDFQKLPAGHGPSYGAPPHFADYYGGGSPAPFHHGPSFGHYSSYGNYGYGAPSYGGYYGFPGFDHTRGTYPHDGYPGKNGDIPAYYGYGDKE